MYCSNCGNYNEDYAGECSKCGQSLNDAGNQRYEEVPNHLVWSILATVFCCLPLGIAAIVYSAQVDTRLRLGDYNGAVDASEKAKTFCWISFGTAIGLGILYFLFAVIFNARLF